MSKKRMFSLLLVLCMILSLMPTSAFAEETPTVPLPESGEATEPVVPDEEAELGVPDEEAEPVVPDEEAEPGVPDEEAEPGGTDEGAGPALPDEETGPVDPEDETEPVLPEEWEGAVLPEGEMEFILPEMITPPDLAKMQLSGVMSLASYSSGFELILGEAASGTYYSDFNTAWTAALTAANSAKATLKLYQDVVINAPLVIGDTDYGFTLDLNGHTIDRGLTKQDYNGRVIEVSNSDGAGEFIIKSGYITGGYDDSNGGGIYVAEEAHIELQYVWVYGNISIKNGGGIYLDNQARLSVMGGGILYNWAVENGGGIYAWEVDGEGGATYGIAENDNYETPAIVLVDADIEENHAYGYGGGIFTHQSYLKATDCEISGNTAEYGGGIYAEGGYSAVYDKARLDMTSCTISDNIASDSGGGLYVDGASSLDKTGGSYYKVGLRECTISGNKANDGDGGGVYYEDSDRPFLEDCTIHNNKATENGGGMCFHNCESTTINSCTIDNNESGNDGGGVSFTNCETPANNNCTISNNKSVNDGGGVYFYFSETPAINSCTIDNNESDNYGGGVYFTQCATPAIDDCTISNNESGGYGGGVYIYSCSRPAFTGCTIRDNQTDKTGGGIYLAESLRLIFKENNDIIFNSSASGGGGFDTSIIRDNDNKPFGRIYVSGTLRVIFNTAGADGHASDVDKHHLRFNFHNIDDSSLTMSENSLIGLDLSYEPEDSAHRITDEDSSTEWYGKCLFSNKSGRYVKIENVNSKYRYKLDEAPDPIGLTGFTSADESKMVVKERDMNYSTHTAKLQVASKTGFFEAASLAPDCNPGVSCNYAGPMELDDKTYHRYNLWLGNDRQPWLVEVELLADVSVKVGQSVGYLTFEDGWNKAVAEAAAGKNVEIKLLTDLNAFDNSGTVAYAPDVTGDGETASGVVTLDLNGFSLTSSFATGETPSLTVRDGGKLTIIDSGGGGTISGGILVADGGELNVAGGRINGGSRTNGGGVYVADGGELSVSGGEISGNAATENGGGVYVANGGELNVSGGEISGNETTENGGGVYLEAGGELSVSGGKISGNTATGDGGGIYVAAGGQTTEGGKLTMSGGEISGSIATEGNGGGAYVLGEMNMSGGEISTNTATKGDGGGVYIAEGGQATVSGGQIRNNTADMGPGVFLHAQAKPMTLSGATRIDGNTAASQTNTGDLCIDPNLDNDNSTLNFVEQRSNFKVTISVDNTIDDLVLGTYDSSFSNSATAIVSDGSVGRLFYGADGSLIRNPSGEARLISCSLFGFDGVIDEERKQIYIQLPYAVARQGLDQVDPRNLSFTMNSYAKPGVVDYTVNNVAYTYPRQPEYLDFSAPGKTSMALTYIKFENGRWGEWLHRYSFFVTVAPPQQSDVKIYRFGEDDPFLTEQYLPDDRVSLTAPAPPAGEIAFRFWQDAFWTDEEGVEHQLLTEAQRKNPEVSFTMPQGDVTLLAVYDAYIYVVNLDPGWVQPGMPLPSCTANGSGYYVESTEWDPNPDIAGFETPYTATVKVRAHANNYYGGFVNSFFMTVNMAESNVRWVRFDRQNDYLIVNYSVTTSTQEFERVTTSDLPLSLVYNDRSFDSLAEEGFIPQTVSVTLADGSRVEAGVSWTPPDSYDAAAAAGTPIDITGDVGPWLTGMGYTIPEGKSTTVNQPIAFLSAIRVAAPGCTPGTGNYEVPQQVRLWTPEAAQGAVVYYTMDGSAPTTSSTLYSGEPFFVSATTTIKAIAERPVTLGNGDVVRLQSDVTSFTFTIPQAAKFWVVCDGIVHGYYERGDEVTIAAPVKSNKVFSEWVGDYPFDIPSEQAASETLVFTMPNHNVRLTPVYLSIVRNISLSVNTPIVGQPMPTVGGGSWAPADATAQAGEEYTLTVERPVAAGHIYADELTATVNGEPATAVRNPDGTATVTYTFPPTADKRMLTAIDPPQNITGIPKDMPVAQWLLPDWVKIRVDGGWDWFSVPVIWNLESITPAYSSTQAQEYTLTGAAVLPDDVDPNGNNSVTITVITNARSIDCHMDDNGDGKCDVCGEPMYAAPTGSGTAASPYLIYTADHLYWFARQVNEVDATIWGTLMNDIVLNSGDLSNWNGVGTPSWRAWTPIGASTETKRYTGTFDGNGMTVSGVYINKNLSTDVNQGLFGYIGTEGVVKNLSVGNSYIKNTGDRTGGVCGHNYGIIENCHNSGKVVGGMYVGGVCGQNNSGTVKNCSNSGTVSSEHSGNIYAGGVCGRNYNGGTITDCYNTGTIGDEYKGIVGGVGGQNNGGTIANCYNSGEVYGSQSVGSVCGDNINTESTTSTISNCYYLAGSGSPSGVGDSKTTTQLANGSVAWLLNTPGREEEGYSHSGKWSQGTGFPVFANETTQPTYKIEVEGGEAIGPYYSGADGTVIGQLPADYVFVYNSQQFTESSEVTQDITITAMAAASAPRIETHPVNQSVVEGAAADFSVVVADSTSTDYQWQLSQNNGVTWVNISGANSDSYSEANVTKTMNGYRYRCVVTDGTIGAITSNAATLTVHYAPEINTQPLAQSAAVGQTATFSVVAIGNPAPRYQWQLSTDGGTWENIVEYAKDASYTTATTTIEMSGNQYRCVVSNNIGADATSEVVTLTVTRNASVTPDAAEYDKHKDTDGLTITINPGSHTLTAIMNGSEPLTAGTDYTFEGNVYTIAPGYLNGQDDDTLTLTFDMSGGLDPTAVITITSTKPIISFTAQPAASKEFVWGKISGSLSAAATATYEGEVTLSWYACDADGVTTGAAISTGENFAIKADLAAGTHYFLCRATCTGAEPVDSQVATVTVTPVDASIGQAFATYDKSQDTAGLTITLNPGSYELTAIMRGSVQLTPGTDYTVSGNDYTITHAYLNAQPVGVVPLTFDMNATERGIDPTVMIRITDIVATPTISPVTGTYTSAQNVTISCTTADATICYTTDGTEPTSASTEYTAPFTVSSSCTVKAKAFATGMTDSATASATYTINIPVTQQYTISVTASPTAGGTVNGGGTFDDGASCTVEATANSGYHFVKWTEGGSEVSTGASYTFNLTGNRNLVAVFDYTGGGGGDVTTYYRLTFNTNGGSAVSSVTRALGNTIDLSSYVPTREGYNFIGWYADEAMTEPVTSVKLRTNTTVFAKWLKANSMDNFKPGGAYNGFLDVDESQWYGAWDEGVIRDAVMLGIMEGYGDGNFGPEDELKIGEAIKIACMIHSIYTGDGYDFTQGDPWYQVYVDYAIANGLIEAGDFSDYTAVCSRSRAAYIFAEALPAGELPKINDLTPPDVAATDEYGMEIYLLYAAGVLQGNDQLGTFGGNGAFTRAQAAAIVTRLALPEKRQKML